MISKNFCTITEDCSSDWYHSVGITVPTFERKYSPCIYRTNLVTLRVGDRTSVLAVSERGVARRYNIKTGQHVAEGQP